jgi:hypothetical protein
MGFPLLPKLVYRLLFSHSDNNDRKNSKADGMGKTRPSCEGRNPLGNEF